MGTINYKTSDYITLGFNCDNFYTNDSDSYYECDMLYEEAESMLDECEFEYFTLGLEKGYYEGFSVVIENNETVFCYNDKKKAQKEITAIKELLTRLSDCLGLVSCRPGWCTGYETVSETIKSIREAVKVMRNDINTIVLA